MREMTVLMMDTGKSGWVNITMDGPIFLMTGWPTLRCDVLFRVVRALSYLSSGCDSLPLVFSAYSERLMITSWKMMWNHGVTCKKIIYLQASKATMNRISLRATIHAVIKLYRIWLAVDPP